MHQYSLIEGQVFTKSMLSKDSLRRIQSMVSAQNNKLLKTSTEPTPQNNSYQLTFIHAVAR